MRRRHAAETGAGDDARPSGTVEDERGLDPIDHAIRVDDDRRRATIAGVGASRDRIFDTADETRANLGARCGRQLTQQAIESRAVHLVARHAGGKRLDASSLGAPPDGVAAPGMKLRILHRGEHSQCGQHLVSTWRNRLGERAPLATGPLDDQHADAPTPRAGARPRSRRDRRRR